MSRKPYLLLIGVLAGGALASGCGGSGPAPAPNTTATSASHTTVTRTTTAGGGRAVATSSSETATAGSSVAATQVGRPASSAQNLAAAVAVCRVEVASATSLTSAEQSQLANLCTVAGSGDKARLRSAERRICLSVIKDSAVGLSGPALSAARASCSRL